MDIPLTKSDVEALRLQAEEERLIAILATNEEIRAQHAAIAADLETSAQNVERSALPPKFIRRKL